MSEKHQRFRQCYKNIEQKGALILIDQIQERNRTRKHQVREKLKLMNCIVGSSLILLFENPNVFIDLITSLSCSIIVLDFLHKVIKFPTESALVHTVKEIGGWVSILIILYRRYVDINQIISDFTQENEILGGTNPNVSELSYFSQITDYVLGWSGKLILSPIESTVSSILDAFIFYIASGVTDRYLTNNVRVVVSFSLYFIFQYVTDDTLQNKIDKNNASMILKLQEECSDAELNTIEIEQCFTQYRNSLETTIKEEFEHCCVIVEEQKNKYTERKRQVMDKKIQNRKEMESRKLEHTLPLAPTTELNLNDLREQLERLQLTSNTK